MTMLRTPEEHFEDLPAYDYRADYVDVGEPRMACVDEGEGEEVFLCLHGEPTWSFLYRKMIPVLREAGRVVVPDLVGFGRSDKYPEMEDYTYEKLYRWLVRFIEELDLENVTLICQDWGGLLGLTVAANHPERFARLVPMNTGLADGTQTMSDAWWEFRDFVEETEDLPIGMLVDGGCLNDLSDDVIRAYEAPFPGPEYKAGARALPLLVPTDPSMGGAEMMGEAMETLAGWEKPAFVLFADSDPITGDARDPMRDLLPTASEQPDVWVQDASHFLQEDQGEQVAEHIVDFVERTS